MKLDHFIHLARTGDPSEPRLILFHGTGGSERDLLWTADAIAPEAGYLSARGQISELGAPRWFRRLAEGVFDMEDLAIRTQEVADWLTLMRKELGEPNRPWIGFGYSNGANIIANLFLQGHRVMDGAIMVRPMLTDEPIPGLDLSGIKLQLQAGVDDQLYPFEQGEQLAQQFEEAGAITTLKPIQAGHNFTQDDILAAQEFLKK
ncbi:MAG: hypothetical protein R2688_06755 [Fimbriimonadaceae bacterium]